MVTVCFDSNMRQSPADTVSTSDSEAVSQKYILFDHHSPVSVPMTYKNPVKQKTDQIPGIRDYTRHAFQKPVFHGGKQPTNPTNPCFASSLPYFEMAFWGRIFGR